MALPLTRARRSRALVASGARVTAESVPTIRRLDQPWQYRALSYYNMLGEVRVGAHFYSRMLQRLRIYAGKRLPDDRIEPIKEGPPVDLLNRIQDPAGGRTAILKSYGRLMFITGEGYLFGLGIGEDHERWQFVWREELRFDDVGRVTHMLAPGIQAVDIETLQDDNNFEPLPDGTAVAYRFWTPHPRFSALPDSPMLSTLDIAEELVLLTSSVHATATSRLVRSKILLMPQEISPGPVNTPGRSEDPLLDPFAQDLGDHFERALEDPSHAASLAPYIIWAFSEYLAHIRPLGLHDSDTDYLERDLRAETIRRLALGWDMPPEAILGLGDTNHWSAWAVREDMWVLHGAPMAEQFCDDLGDSYLRPALRDMGYEDWEEVVVAYDETGVVVNPDRSKDADEAFDRGAISYEAYRHAKRFVEADAQDEDEHNEYLAIKLKDPAIVGEPPPEKITETGPPPGQPGPVSEQTNLPESARLSGAAELALLRCRELAGSRLRSRRDSCPECLEANRHVPNAKLAAALGESGLVRLGLTEPMALVRGGSDIFRQLCVMWGVEPGLVTDLCGQIEVHAAHTLFDEEPNGFYPLVPDALAR